MAKVELQSINKVFGRVHIIHDVDLVIEDGEFVVFVGPSGCGKSTLLRLIAGLEDISSGDLLIDGEKKNDATPPQRGVGMVFQSYALYPHMTVYENMAFGLKLAKHDAGTVDERVQAVAKTLQLEALLDRTPKQLSGGQRQRVAIGRAIVREPKVFLFDEPLSNLDAALRVQMRMEIARLHARLKATMVYVTHDQVEAMTLAEKIVVLRDGRIEQVGSPLTLYNQPANTFVAGFIGSPKMNLLQATVVEPGGTWTKVKLDQGQEVAIAVDGSRLTTGDAVQVGIRPEHLVFGEADLFNGDQPSEVHVVEQLGNESLLYLANPQEPMPVVLRCEGQTGYKMGSMVKVQIPGHRAHLFDSDGNALPRSSEAEQSSIIS
ncbi:ABC transporter ATP-binding protein [Salinibius halmophilus]|uniref:ABC transporter ATP-binding protein n=1 Tax=Salinibius halmophilus TaxID=1853216 RepID=UPI000E666BAD|nr:sn-glycerol-3-phosphate ABC transporter ATP-binding protein UgpC [Salinibius halmophilus]